MRILVTGAAGFIGSHLSERLLADGHEVIGVDGFIDSYPRSYKEANLATALEHARFTFHELDLRSAPLDTLLDGVDAVINEAAMPGLPRSWTEFDSYLTNNTQAMERILRASVRAGVRRFVQASTSSVYGRFAVGDESLPTVPVSPYGVTKLAAEQLAIAYMHDTGLPVVILRYFSIYGPRQRPDMAYNIFSEALLDGQPLTVYGDGHQSRSSTFVSDCVDGTVAGLERGQPGEVYNIGGARTITLLDAIRVLAEELGARPVLRHEDVRAGDQRDTKADTSKAQRELAYHPTVEPAVGLRRQAAWHRDRRGAQGRSPEGSG